MAKVKVVLNWWIPIVLITVALMVPTIAGAAGSLQIWPDQLKPEEPVTGYIQNYLQVGNGAFSAPLKLPVGARITKATYYHQGYGGAFTNIYITRVKMGGVPEDVMLQTSEDSTGEIIPVDVPISVDPIGDPIIRAGYRYYVQVNANDSSYIWGVKINYRE
jgi:hypothetical protein